MDDGGRESNNAGQSTNWHSPVVLSAIELRKKEGRGKLLSTLIILKAIPVLVGIPIGVIYSVLHPQSFNLYGFLISILVSMLEGVLLLGIWKWKKKATYGFLVLLVVRLAPVFIILLLLLEPSDVLEITVWGTLAILLFELILWIWAIHRKWHLFT
jgi:hypothetical protein